MADKTSEGDAARSCAHCQQAIQSKVLLYALEHYWHEDCLKCSYCNKKLYDISNKFYFRQDLLLCKTDYIRLFGTKGRCSLCFKDIPPLESVMRARNHVFHLNCFACQVCGYRFCIGDSFFLYQNTVLCEEHYEDLFLST